MDGKVVYIYEKNRKAIYDGLIDIVPGKQMFCHPEFRSQNSIGSMRIHHYLSKANVYFAWNRSASVLNPLDWPRLLWGEMAGSFGDLECSVKNKKMTCKFGRNLPQAAIGKAGTLKLDFNKAMIVYMAEDWQEPQSIPYWTIPATLQLGFSKTKMYCTQYATDSYQGFNREFVRDLGPC